MECYENINGGRSSKNHSTNCWKDGCDSESMPAQTNVWTRQDNEFTTKTAEEQHFKRKRRTWKRSRWETDGDALRADECETRWWSRRRTRIRSGSRPRKGINNSSRITRHEWLTLPVETLVERRLLDMSLMQLELRCTNNTVHYVLNNEDSKDPLLNSNEVRQLLGKTPKFLPTPKPLQPKNVENDCNLFG